MISNAEGISCFLRGCLLILRNKNFYFPKNLNSSSSSSIQIKNSVQISTSQKPSLNILYIFKDLTATKLVNREICLTFLKT